MTPISKLIDKSKYSDEYKLINNLRLIDDNKSIDNSMSIDVSSRMTFDYGYVRMDKWATLIVIFATV